jgi:hypothetical protein
MRYHLIVSVCVCAIGLSSPAHALIVVEDPASILVEAKTLAQEAKQYLVQAQQYATQVQQYAAEIEQLNGFIHDPSLGAAMGLMNREGLGNSLPINPMVVASLTHGYGSLTSLTGLLGKLNQLNGLVNTNFDANHVYTCQDTSTACMTLNAGANSNAAMQGTAQSVYQDLRNHLPILQALRDRLATARTPKDVMDAQAALQAEQAWTANLQSELNSVQANYQTQVYVQQQRDNERLDQSANQFLEAAKAQGMGLGQ